MSAQLPSAATLLTENAVLRSKLEDAQEMLRAIRSGEVDALIVESDAGPQVYTLQGLDAETNRFRGDMLAQVSDAVIAFSGEDRIIYLNAAAERLYGFAASEALGQTRSRIYHSRWLYPGDEAVATAALREHGQWRGESVHVRYDDREVNVESTVTVLPECVGQPAGSLAIVRDVTERRQHEDRVQLSEIRYRRLFEAAHDGILILDAMTHKIIDANPLMTQMLGCSHSQLAGQELSEIGLFKDQAECLGMFHTLEQMDQVHYPNLSLVCGVEKPLEVEVVATLYDESGRRVIQCTIRDITERRRSEEHVKLLMAEVNHRAKNLLAVVQAVAHQTAKYGDPVTFAKRLSDRIDGLAAGQDLLVKNKWQGVEVADLVEAQLAHFKDLIGSRVLIEGPRVRLTMAAAQGIGMALHELATNAAKYGALSNLEGQVRIAWQITAATKPSFSMSWLEVGGPKVVAPTRKGFGQVVIGRMAEAAVEGVAEVQFRENGLTWHLRAPVQNALSVSLIGR